MQQEQPTVVIIGGSISGLMAASVLGEHARVIIVEKDAEPNTENYTSGRQGTPQDRHLHALLEGGRKAMEEYFPDFISILLANGARECDRAKDISWFHADVWKLRYRDGGLMYLAPRPSIDKTLRESLHNKFAARPGHVNWQYGKRAIDILVSEDGETITGVKLDDGTVFECTLVVDASGRTGGAARLLSKHGFDAEPDLSTLKIDVSYSTMVFEFPMTQHFDAEFLIRHPSHDFQRGVGCMQVAANTVPGGRSDCRYALATQFGYGVEGKVQHASVQEYMRDLETLPQQQAFQLLSQGKPMFDKPYGFLYNQQIKRHWDKLTNLPQGFLSVGDAVCSFDPVFGQGMSHAVLGIAKLASIAPELVRGNYCARARKLVANQGFVPFLMNTIEDFRYQGTEGKRPPFLGLLQTLASWMFRAQQRSEAVSRKLWRVAHFQSSPLSLVDPVFWTKVVWYGR